MPKLGVRLNITNGGLGQVTGWSFNSVAQLEDKLLGLTSEGVSLIGGDSDNGANIDSIVRFPLSDFTVKQPKRIRKGYIDYETDGSINVECIANEDKSFTATITKGETDKETSKVFFGNRNYVGTNWEFEITNVDGADFALDYLGVLFVPVTRSRGL